jgi:hypothetical protein
MLRSASRLQCWHTDRVVNSDLLGISAIPTEYTSIYYGTCVVYLPRYTIEECDWYKGEKLTA